ncbi:hypothetical protein F0562_022629, partial [Nyssa sinensis]
MPGVRRCREARPEARAARHDRRDGVSASISTARALAAPPIRIGPRPEPIGGLACRRSTSDRGASPAPIRFPPDNFKHSLTLFSKSFSSFPRGTCLLSVSRPYLALDGIYRPIGAAFPNNPTRRQRLVVRQGPGTTGLSPSPAPPSRGLGPGPPLRTLLQTTIRTAWPHDFQAGLFPVRSPLLRESCRRNGASGSLEVPHRTGCARDSTQLRPGANQPPLIATSVAGDSFFGQPRALAHGRPVSAPDRPASWSRRGVGGATQCVTPRQTCPRPSGFGRNLRSKTRWFTGFCNSHQVSHFATFFIDARAEISVAESRFVYTKDVAAAGTPRERGVGNPSFVVSSLAQIAPGFVFSVEERARTRRSRRGELAPPDVFHTFAGRSAG